MGYTQAGTCPHCGAPLWVPTAWWAIIPPPVMYSCNCVPHHNSVVSSTSVTISAVNPQTLERVVTAPKGGTP